MKAGSKKRETEQTVEIEEVITAYKSDKAMAREITKEV